MKVKRWSKIAQQRRFFKWDSLSLHCESNSLSCTRYQQPESSKNLFWARVWRFLWIFPALTKCIEKWLFEGGACAVPGTQTFSQVPWLWAGLTQPSTGPALPHDQRGGNWRRDLRTEPGYKSESLLQKLLPPTHHRELFNSALVFRNEQINRYWNWIGFVFCTPFLSLCLQKVETERLDVHTNRGFSGLNCLVN